MFYKTGVLFDTSNFNFVGSRDYPSLFERGTVTLWYESDSFRLRKNCRIQGGLGGVEAGLDFLRTVDLGKEVVPLMDIGNDQMRFLILSSRQFLPPINTTKVRKSHNLSVRSGLGKERPHHRNTSRS